MDIAYHKVTVILLAAAALLVYMSIIAM